jgi:hypothetical protein
MKIVREKSVARDIEWLRLQVTLMRWHLDAAGSAAAEAVHQYLRRARNAYENSESALAECQLTHEERREVEMALSSLSTELELRGAR